MIPVKPAQSYKIIMCKIIWKVLCNGPNWFFAAKARDGVYFLNWTTYSALAEIKEGADQDHFCSFSPQHYCA